MSKKKPARTFDNLRHPDREKSKDKAQTAAAFAVIAMLPEWRIAFGWMKSYAERPLGPDASDGALRGAEAVRQFVRAIEGMIVDGGRTKS